ncbi:hypothetical protein BGLCM_1189 [Bifidobacterium gallicum DSM 20093 = LMG 11596]|uniref:Uncharacterized protein n=1 Tax=Bifidobacterium gallicum DSM 20093 = LMG 11596 TaxID=561180 RepID=A0A087AJE3_9BIFI|nr:hypothetical protein BGLCM_1189 [Bifidobacterium gallicum DSM 20093 = LMG 11596]
MAMVSIVILVAAALVVNVSVDKAALRKEYALARVDD